MVEDLFGRMPEAVSPLLLLLRYPISIWLFGYLLSFRSKENSTFKRI